jgi:hypothetical protein
MADSQDNGHLTVKVELQRNVTKPLPGGGSVCRTPMGCSTMSIEVEVTTPGGKKKRYRLNRGDWQSVGNGVELKFDTGTRIMVRTKF